MNGCDMNGRAIELRHEFMLKPDECPLLSTATAATRGLK